jgi:SAM-dependent methyltransferase
MEARDLRCPVCGAIPRPWFEKLGRKVHRCPACHHVSVPAGLALADDGLSIYESERPIFEMDGNIEYYLDDGNMLAAQAKAAFVREYCPERGRLLDVGSSYGHFLAAIGSAHEAYGLELNRRVVCWSIDHFGVASRVGSIYEMPSELPGSFDLITCWDVIEHLEHPQLALDRIRERLKPGGWLFLSTPDAGSIVARLMGRHWHYMDPVQHINLFSRSNLSRALLGAGFTIRNCRYLGHPYRVSYVLNRLSYLARETPAGAAIRLLTSVAGPLKRVRVSLKLWDVMGVAAQLQSGRVPGTSSAGRVL